MTTSDDDRTITEISLISGVSTDDVQKVFEALTAHIVFDYSKDNYRINIPYTGNIMLRYVGDKSTPEGKEADIDVFFSPHSKLKQSIGQIHDIEENEEDPKNFNIFQMIRKIIKFDFKTKLSNE